MIQQCVWEWRWRGKCNYNLHKLLRAFYYRYFAASIRDVVRNVRFVFPAFFFCIIFGWDTEATTLKLTSVGLYDPWLRDNDWVGRFV